jgi:phosphomevalonate kinase
MPEAEPLALSLDTREFVDVATATKLGIGSSAALTVSLAAALRAALDSDANLDDIAMAAHRNLQQGVGSGVDIACSLRGGIITYRMHGSIGRIPGWPDDLVFALLWSGVSASTTDRLSKLEDQPSRPSRAALADAASRAAASWAAGESAAITAEMKAYTVALQEFSIDHGLGIFDAGHGDLAAMAPDDVVYKPCGAGGGDLGIALGRDEEAVAEFVGLAAAYGFQPIDLAISPVGIQTAREED